MLSLIPVKHLVLVLFIELKIEHIILFEDFEKFFVASKLKGSKLIIIPVLLVHILDIALRHGLVGKLLLMGLSAT